MLTLPSGLRHADWRWVDRKQDREMTEKSLAETGRRGAMVDALTGSRRLSRQARRAGAR